jgi:hypothetical protein
MVGFLGKFYQDESLDLGIYRDFPKYLHVMRKQRMVLYDWKIAKTGIYSFTHFWMYPIPNRKKLHGGDGA